MTHVPWLRMDAHKFHDWAQGAFAISAIIAIVVGAVLYFAERRDKPRMILEPRSAVIGIKEEGEGRLEAVLLQFSVGIENRSSRGLTFNCAAIDIIGLHREPKREDTYTDDLSGDSLLPANPKNPNWTACVDGFEKRRRIAEQRSFKARSRSNEWVNPPQPTPAPTSGARYRDFFMEPGEVMTKTWEHRVPCDYDAVRVIFKLPKPYSVHDYETKILVPIADVCANKRNVSILQYAPEESGGHGDKAAKRPSGSADNSSG